MPRERWHEIRDDALLGIRQRKKERERWNEEEECEKVERNIWTLTCWKLKCKLKVSYENIIICHIEKCNKYD